MKRILCLVFALSIAFCLTGCVGIINYEKAYRDRDAALVKSIELYSLQNFEGGLALKYSVPKAEYTIDDLDALAAPSHSLSESDFRGFINDLDAIKLKSTFVQIMDIEIPPQKSYSGYVIKIGYIDGSYDIISREAQIYYTSSGDKEYENAYDKSGWRSLIEKYFGLSADNV